MPSATARIDHVPGTLDLTDPGLHAEQDLSGYFRDLRANNPVSWQQPAEGRGYWLVSRHADATTVCRDAESFGATGGNVMDTLLHGRASMKSVADAAYRQSDRPPPRRPSAVAVSLQVLIGCVKE